MSTLTSQAPAATFQYFSGSGRSESDDFRLTTLGYIDVRAGAEYPPRDHPQGYAYRWRDGRQLDEYQVHFISRGSGSLESTGTTGAKHPLFPGSTFILFPHIWHRYAPAPDTGWSEFWLGLRGPLVEQLFRSQMLSARNPLPAVVDGPRLANLFGRAVATLFANDLMAQEARRALATLILSELSMEPSPAALASGSVVQRAVQLLNGMDGRVNLEKLAEQLAVGYHMLRFRFRKEMGCSMQQFLTGVRLERAAGLLRDSQLTITQVAERCGFEDPYYFSRVFRKHFGMSPKPYRARGVERHL